MQNANQERGRRNTQMSEDLKKSDRFWAKKMLARIKVVFGDYGGDEMNCGVIWKYELNDTDNRITMPEGAKPLTVQIQHGKIVLWCKVDPIKAASTIERRFVVRGTGHNFEVEGMDVYLGTVQTMAGLVWHVFEVMG